MKISQSDCHREACSLAYPRRTGPVAGFRLTREECQGGSTSMSSATVFCTQKEGRFSDYLRECSQKTVDTVTWLWAVLLYPTTNLWTKITSQMFTPRALGTKHLEHTCVLELATTSILPRISFLESLHSLDRQLTGPALKTQTQNGNQFFDSKHHIRQLITACDLAPGHLTALVSVGICTQVHIPTYKHIIKTNVFSSQLKTWDMLRTEVDAVWWGQPTSKLKKTAHKN